jgi:hypothetical protein
MRAHTLSLVFAALALAPVSGACGSGGGGAGTNIPAPSETGEPKGPGSEPPGGGQEPGSTGNEPTGGGGYESPGGSSSGASSSGGGSSGAGSSGGSSSGVSSSGGTSSSGGVAIDCPVCTTYSCSVTEEGQTTMQSITLQSVASPSGACSVTVAGTTYVLLCGGVLQADDDAGDTGGWLSAGTTLSAGIDGIAIVCL